LFRAEERKIMSRRNFIADASVGAIDRRKPGPAARI
jgi:hypothetical protein